MSNITAAQVKELRELTNEGMMECKAALVEANGDIQKAIEIMRTKGANRAVKKAGRVASEGSIVVNSTPNTKRAVLIEINSETDFVARDHAFQAFAQSVGELALQNNIEDIESLKAATEEKRLALVAKVGENITVRRMAALQSPNVVGTYAHGDANGTRIGVLVALKKGSLALAKDLAMQVAAMNPEYLSEAEIPKARLESEKEILMAQTREEKKPDAMLEKIVTGKLKKFMSDVTLLAQPFVKDPSKTIQALLTAEGGEIERFVRFAVGEGIEKKEDDFVKEVMEQVKS